MSESTSECRKDCDVYEAWLKLVSDNVELVLKNTKLEAENKKQAFMIGKFENWYCDNGCPFSETKESFCPEREELEAEHKKAMDTLPEDERYDFDPTEDCGYSDRAGYCYARYYEKLFEKLALKGGEE